MNIQNTFINGTFVAKIVLHVSNRTLWEKNRWNISCHSRFDFPCPNTTSHESSFLLIVFGLFDFHFLSFASQFCGSLIFRDSFFHRQSVAK